jgi:hypothetical protein
MLLSALPTCSVSARKVSHIFLFHRNVYFLTMSCKCSQHQTCRRPTQCRSRWYKRVGGLTDIATLRGTFRYNANANYNGQKRRKEWYLIGLFLLDIMNFFLWFAYRKFAQFLKTGNSDSRILKSAWPTEVMWRNAGVRQWVRCCWNNWLSHPCNKRKYRHLKVAQ